MFGRARRWLGLALVGILATAGASRAIVGALVSSHVVAEVHDRQTQFRSRLESIRNCLSILRAHLDAESDPTPQRFANAAGELLISEPALRAMSWNPFVREADRPGFVEWARRLTGDPGFRIRVVPTSGMQRPAGLGADHVVVLLIEPRAENEAAVGLDIAGEARRREMIEHARDSMDFAITARIELVQLPDRAGILAALPRYDPAMRVGTIEERWAAFRGLVVGVVDVGRLVETALGERLRNDFDIDIVDVTAGASTDLFRHRVTRELAGGALGVPTPPPLPRVDHSERLDFGGRSWRFDYAARPEYLASIQGGAAAGSWTVGILLTVLIVIGAFYAGERERRRAAERGLQRLRETLEVISDGWWEWDILRDRRTLSSSLLQTLGQRSEAGAPSSIFEDRIHPDDAGARRDAIRDHLEGNSARYEHEFRVRHFDGEDRWVRERGSIVSRDHRGQPTRMVGAIDDITRQKMDEERREALEDQVRETERLEGLRLVAAGVAHDFNNWLTTIRNNATLTRQRWRESDGSTAEHLQEIEKAVGEAAALTSQLLDYLGKGQLQMERLEVGELAEKSRPLIRAMFGREREFELKRSPTPAVVEGDRALLISVLVNLVKNAVDALNGRGEVRIEVWTEEIPAPLLTESRSGIRIPAGRYAVMSVADDGPGMPPEIVSRMFDPFFTTKAHGRGIGLARVQGIVRRHGGYLLVDTALGRGTRISVYLPEATGPVETTDPPSARRGLARPAAGRLRRILVVDDEEAVRQSLVKILLQDGHAVEEAASGAEAIACVRAEPTGFDLTVLDITMPGLDGLETFASMQAVAPALQAILISGYSDDDLGTLPEGVIGFLRKPFETEDLLGLVRRDAEPRPTS